MPQAELHYQIILRSEAKVWDKARGEWKLNDVWISKEPETCLCGHRPIKEICEIKNRLNGRTTEVGNCCVKHFGLERKDAVFNSIKRVKGGKSSSFNEETIELAHDLRIISDRDREFYLNIWRKNDDSLSDAQLKWKRDINRSLLSRFVKTGQKPTQG